MNITSENANGRLLIALRAGPMDTSQMAERLPGGGYSTGTLRAIGYISLANGIFSITELGRQACPTRRQSISSLNPTNAELTDKDQPAIDSLQMDEVLALIASNAPILITAAPTAHEQIKQRKLAKIGRSKQRRAYECHA